MPHGEPLECLTVDADSRPVSDPNQSRPASTPHPSLSISSAYMLAGAVCHILIPLTQTLNLILPIPFNGSGIL